MSVSIFMLICCACKHAYSCVLSLPTICLVHWRCANALASKDPNLQTLLDGWEWTVLDAKVETELPNIPQFIQKAMNSVNSTYKVQSELELCAEIVQAAQSSGTSFPELGKALCMDTRIMPFAHILGEYCQKFAGGSDGPMIQFLHAFSLEFGKGIQLGHEFWECVTKSNFGEEGLFVFTRSLVCKQVELENHGT